MLLQESLWSSTVSCGDTYVEKSKGFFTTSALKVSKCGPSRANASLGLCANHKNSATPRGHLEQGVPSSELSQPLSTVHSLTSWLVERGLNVSPTFLPSARLLGKAQPPVTASPHPPPHSLSKLLPAQAPFCHPGCNYAPRLHLTFSLTHFLS